MKTSKKRYRYEISYLTEFGSRVSDIMNQLDLDGRYGVQTDVLTFSSTSQEKTPIQYRDHIKWSYEQLGCEILGVTGGEIV